MVSPRLDQGLQQSSRSIVRYVVLACFNYIECRRVLLEVFWLFGEVSLPLALLWNITYQAVLVTLAGKDGISKNCGL